MEVLILSKTKYGNTQVCVGGICINNKQFIRLLNHGGYYQPSDTQFNIGDIWKISFTPTTTNREPHNEDVTIHTYKFVRKIYPLETYIKSMGVPIWRDNIANIFEGKIRWTGNGKGYFSENINNYPSHSVGFWISDIDLRHQRIGDQDLYVYQNNGITRQIVYKGSQDVLPIIPKGKLIRLSLAKWWKPQDSNIEARCYLQLSGWYEDQVEPIEKIESKLVEPKPIERAHTVIKTTEQPKNQAHKTTQQPKNTSGGCYIATLCYEDYFADEVCTFRDFRDNTLREYYLGKIFIEKYYIYAPKIARILTGYSFINKQIKLYILNPLLRIIKVFKLDK